MERKLKDSGVAWIGDIPADWDIKKGKWILSRLERPVQEDDGVVTCFRDGEVTLRSNRREDGFTISLQEAGYQGINVGDLVVHGMDGFAGAIGISDSRGKGTPVLNVLDSTQNKRYIMYYLRSMAYNGVFLALATGIRVRSCDTNWNKLKELPYPKPTLDEQTTIADFLDRRCAEVDSVVANTLRTIEEYKKLRQSIITEAVTRGVCNEHTLKDSEIAWIEHIPAEWNVVRLKSMFSFGKGLPITKDNLVETGIPVISYGQIHSKMTSGVELQQHLFRYVDESYLDANPQSLVHQGDFIFADTSEDFEGCGNAVYINEEMTLFAGYHTIILSSKDSTDNKYIAYQFQTDLWRSQIRSRVSGVKVFSISRKILGDATIILPPADEREKIVAYLDEKCEAIDRIIAAKQQLIAEMEVYKKSVIYEYVTGKKEVPACQ